jgi:hypothetical protein
MPRGGDHGSHRDRGGGGGSGYGNPRGLSSTTPYQASGSTRLARGRPGVGAHLAGDLAGAGPGVDPHVPWAGQHTHFLLP